jgi:putative flippase GtrA
MHRALRAGLKACPTLGSCPAGLKACRTFRWTSEARPGRDTVVRPLRYLAVATLGAGVQAIVVAAAAAAGMPPVTATLLGIEAAILHNFAWHDRWTWQDRPRREPRALRLARYNGAMATTSLALGGAVSWVVFEWAGGGLVIANVAAVAAGAIANYYASDRLIFRKRLWSEP